MPVHILLIGGCWFWGSFICGLFYYASFLLTSASVGNMVLISVDRYVAICDPLCYLTKVTQKRVQVCVCLCWACSALYNGLILMDYLEQPERFNSCYGECIVVVDSITGAVDVMLTFVGPIVVIVVLYMRVFVVAVSQARAMRSRKVAANKSELKAATTLGVVVLVFLICVCPYYCVALTGQDTMLNASFAYFVICLSYFNSCLNPLIYTFFYPWFRKSVRLIVTLKILKPDSCKINIL
uniref:G-protein coupled receptors family 1 profile domain-containing protein n=1 Tax=Sparus aurata TaxID=8175 RepID=A0A671Z112_SPAAU